MSRKVTITLHNQTSRDLNLDGSTTGTYRQNWYDLPDSIPSGSKKTFHESTPGPEERGKVYFIVEENGNTLELKTRLGMTGRNKFQVFIDGEDAKFKTKMGSNGTWGDWGVVDQGTGDLYVDCYVGSDS